MASNPRRDELKALSAPLLSLKKLGEIKTINEGLVKIYNSQGHSQLNTLRQWNEQGMRIRSGEKSLLLWAKPKKQKQDEEEDDFTFFPLCYVFSEKQVFKI